MSDGMLSGPVPRCCARHCDWADIGDHLVAEFRELPAFEVGREVARAREATELVAMDGDEALYIGELIARYQLMIRAGRLAEVARLDPEAHPARRRGPAPAASRRRSRPAR